MDIETEKYLGRLIGDRAQSRRSLLRRAQEKLDSMRPPAAGTPSEGVGSVGSLKAIVVDAPSNDGAVAGATGERELGSRPSPSSRRRSARSAVRTLALVAAVLPIAFGAGLWIRSAWQAAPARAGAATAPMRDIAPVRESAPVQVAPRPALAAAQPPEVPAVTPPAPLATAPAISSPPAPKRVAAAKPKAPRKPAPQAPVEAARRDGRDVGLLPPDYAEKH